MHSVISYLKSQKRENVGDAVGCWKWDFSFSRERKSHFSLDLRLIRPSKFFGARRKVVLRDDAYAWALILRSFDKLHEVGDLSYLGLLFV